MKEWEKYLMYALLLLIADHQDICTAAKFILGIAGGMASVLCIVEIIRDE